MNKQDKRKDSKRTQVNKAKMLRCLKITLGNVRKACDLSGVKKSTFYDWLKADVAYSEAVLNVYRITEEFAIDTFMSAIGDNVDELLKAQRRTAKRVKLITCISIQ
jgi:hypothetical protein